MSTPKKITLASGQVRYRIVLDAGRDPETGKRRQLTMTFARKKDALAEAARVRHERTTGTYVAPSKMTVAELIDRYLKHAADGAEENTKANYQHALEPARLRLGDRRALDVDREDIAELKDWMMASGRKRGGTPGTGLSPRSVRLTLGRLSAAFELAIIDRKLTYNPVRYVRPPKPVKPERATWSEAQVRAFLAEAAQDRLSAAWRMTVFGLRRGEILGLRWEDIDMAAMTVTIGRARVLCDYEIIEKAPKSELGYRTLPLDAQLDSALRALRRCQRAERLAAGPAYEDSGYLVTDELGRPVHPEWFSDEFRRVSDRAALPLIRLHDGRHTANSLMAAAGVPPHIRAAWCGHTQGVNEQVYTHARPEDMAVAAAALSKISKGM